ncbi:MAG: hypothetical protein RSC55_00625, partial [Oscillospiraceae bacterium]
SQKSTSARAPNYLVLLMQFRNNSLTALSALFVLDTRRAAKLSVSGSCIKLAVPQLLPYAVAQSIGTDTLYLFE